MAHYSFKEVIDFFSHKLRIAPPIQGDVEGKEVELIIDRLHVVIAQGKFEGSLHMHLPLGLVLRQLPEERLKELGKGNFLGVNTGGCTFALADGGSVLTLHCHTTPGATPQDNWEWLHRILSVAREWHKVLTTWDLFIPVNVPGEKK